MGKNISGTGMDTKVIGRIGILGQNEPELPNIKRILVLNLTHESHGNAIGMGLADITTKKLFNEVDIDKTFLNSISSMSPEQGRFPSIAENDKEALEAAVNTLGAKDAEKLKIVYIKNTSDLEYLYISEYLLKEKNNENLQMVAEAEKIKFDEDGFLFFYF